MIILETARLTIRPFADADIPPAFAYSQEQCTRDELPDEVFGSLDETADRLHLLMEQYEPLSLPLVYAVASKDTGMLIGHVSLSSIGGGRIEIGYAIATAYQGHGYASELIRPFADWARATLGLDHLYGIVKASNTASRKCLEKAGFTLQTEETRTLFGGVHRIMTYLI